MKHYHSYRRSFTQKGKHNTNNVVTENYMLNNEVPSTNINQQPGTPHLRGSYSVRVKSNNISSSSSASPSPTTPKITIDFSKMSVDMKKQCFKESKFDTIRTVDDDNQISEGLMENGSVPRSSPSPPRTVSRCGRSSRINSDATRNNCDTAAARHNMPKKQEVNLAITLVGISLLFILCQSVKMITDMYERLCEKKDLGGIKQCTSSLFIETAISLANLSSCINSAANFMVYMIRGKKFRDLFLETYCWKRPKFTSNFGNKSARSVVYSIKRRDEVSVPLDRTMATTATVLMSQNSCALSSQLSSDAVSFKKQKSESSPTSNVSGAKSKMMSNGHQKGSFQI